MSSFLLTAAQSVNFGYQARTAGKIARASEVMVRLNFKKLQADPVSDDYNSKIEAPSQKVIFISADQALKFGEEIGMAANMALASNCMVHIDPHKLQAYPMTDEFNALIEVVGPNDVHYADVINLTAPSSAKNVA